VDGLAPELLPLNPHLREIVAGKSGAIIGPHIEKGASSRGHIADSREYFVMVLFPTKQRAPLPGPSEKVFALGDLSNAYAFKAATTLEKTFLI
jgi:hypothetical protein